MTETNTREHDGVMILDCSPEDFGDIVDRVGALTEGAASSILLNMSRIETLKGEGLECLMLARDLAKDRDARIGLCGVSFYVHQLMKVLEITDQVPTVFAAEDEALAALKGLNGQFAEPSPVIANGADGADQDEPEFEFDDLPEAAVPPEAPAPLMPPPPSTLKTVEEPSEGRVVDQAAVTSKFIRSDFDLPDFEDEAAASSRSADASTPLLAVNFADFVPPRKDETIEFEIDGGLAFADTDKFSASEVLDYQDTGGPDLSIASRPTEVFPAFSDLDTEEHELAEAPGAGSRSLEGIPDTWLTVDFRDFQPGSGLSRSATETDPERFDLDFGAESEESDLDKTPRLSQTPLLGTPAPFPAAPEEGGYSPIGARRSGDNPFKDLSHVPQEPPTQVGLGEAGEAFPILGGQHFSSMETQEIQIPKIEGADLSLIDTQSLPAVNEGETEKLSIMDTQPLEVAKAREAAEQANSPPEPHHFSAMETQEIQIPNLEAPPGFPHDPTLSPGHQTEDEAETKPQEVSSDFFDISKDLEGAARPPSAESSVYDTEPMSVFSGPAEVQQAEVQQAELQQAELRQNVEEAPTAALGQDFASELVAHVLGEIETPPNAVGPAGADTGEAAGVVDAGGAAHDDDNDDYSGEDSVILTPEMTVQLQDALRGLNPSPYSSEDSMILTPEQAGMLQGHIARALEDAASAASAPPSPPEAPLVAPPAPSASEQDLKGELERLREAERQRLEAEFAALREAERQRTAAKLEAERRRAEGEMARVREEERQRLEEEMEAIRSAERKRVEEEMARIREAERQRYEQQIEEERQRADKAVSESQAAERRRLEDELKRAREEERRRLEAKLKAAQGPAARPGSAPGPAGPDGAKKAGFKQWAGELLQSRPQAGPNEPKLGNLAPHRELEQFVKDYAISSALHIQILTHLKNNGGRPVGKQEVAAILNGSLALVGQILDDFVQAKIVKRVRAPRIRGGYGYSFSASPKIRGQIIALLRLANDPEHWPAVQKWVSEQGA